MESKDKKENIAVARDNGVETPEQNAKKRYHNPCLHVYSTHEYIRGKEMQHSRNYFDGLHEEFLNLVDRSIQRARGNGRTRLMKKDL